MSSCVPSLLIVFPASFQLPFLGSYLVLVVLYADPFRDRGVSCSILTFSLGAGV